MPLGHNVLIPRQSFLAAKYPTKGWSLADLEKVALPYSDRQSSTLLHFCSLSAKCQRVVGYFEVLSPRNQYKSSSQGTHESLFSNMPV